MASPKWPSGDCPGRSTTYSPRPSSLTTERERSGNRAGSSRRRWARNPSSARASGSVGSRPPWAAASSTRRAQRSGGAQHSTQRGQALRLEVFRGDPVGRDHEVLDQLLGAVLLVRPEVGDQVAVEHGPGLPRLEAQRAPLVPEGLHGLRDPILDPQLLVEPRDGGEARGGGPGPVEPGRDAVVRELGAVPHERAVHVGRGDRPVGADHHLDDDRQPRLVLTEGREIGRELLGQHREDLGRGVDRGRVGPCVPIDGRARLHQRVDVGDRDEHLDRPLAHRRGDGELIEVARVVVVDRAPQEIAKVPDRGARVGRGLPDRLGLRLRRGGEIRQESTLGHRPVRDGPELVAIRDAGSIHAAHSS